MVLSCFFVLSGHASIRPRSDRLANDHATSHHGRAHSAISIHAVSMHGAGGQVHRIRCHV